MKLHLCESTNTMTVSEFMDSIEDTYNKYFPNSYCAVKFSKNLGKTIWIDCYLAKNNKEVSNGYFANDMFSVSFHIYLPDDAEPSSAMPDSVALESTNSWIKVKPSNKYLAFDARKIPFRKSTGNAEKIIGAFDRYVKKLYTIVSEEFENDNIEPKFKSLVAEKI